jgi:tetratricopeptide (TPR) repeat protein
VTGVARALAHQDRWQEADQFFVKAQDLWPLKSTANAINIAANRARYLLYSGRPNEALLQIDAAIAEARRREVNPDALAAMHHARACTLHDLGRISEAGVSTAIALAAEHPANRALLQLCLGNASAARSMLLEALDDPFSRDGIIGFVQTRDEPALPSEYGRKLSAKVDSLRKDPILVKAVQKYGRILPFSLIDGAAAESR